MEKYDNNIYGDKQVKKAIYIIIFCSLLLLTGCDNKQGDEGFLKSDEEILRSEEMDLLDVKLFATLEKVLGIHFTNYRLVTLQEPISKNEESSANGQGGQEATSGEQSMNNNENQTVEITEIVDDNTVFEKNTEPDWERAQQYVRQVSDIFIDIQIELSKLGVSQEEISEYGEYISNIVSDISNKDKEKSIQDLERLYVKLYDIVTKMTQDERVITTRKLYYDLIKLLLYLEQKDEEKFNTILEIVKEDIKEVDKAITSDNKTYIKQRINMLVQNIDYTKYNDTKLKLIMIINSMPVLEYKTEKAS